LALHGVLALVYTIQSCLQLLQSISCSYLCDAEEAYCTVSAECGVLSTVEYVTVIHHYWLITSAAVVAPQWLCMQLCIPTLELCTSQLLHTTVPNSVSYTQPSHALLGVPHASTFKAVDLHSMLEKTLALFQALQFVPDIMTMRMQTFLKPYNRAHANTHHNPDLRCRTVLLNTTSHS
jgi:hypothetical protein